eukprot:110788-Amorphochlora_amoeboformis.AAC.1
MHIANTLGALQADTSRYYPALPAEGVTLTRVHRSTRHTWTRGHATCRSHGIGSRFLRCGRCYAYA